MKESRAFVTSTAQVSTSGSNLMPQAHRAFRSLHRCTLHNQPINVGSIEQGCVRSFEHVIDLASVLIYRFVLTAAVDHAVSWRLANAVDHCVADEQARVTFCSWFCRYTTSRYV